MADGNGRLLQQAREFAFNDLSWAKMCAVVDDQNFFLADRWQETWEYRPTLYPAVTPPDPARARWLRSVNGAHRCSNKLVSRHVGSLPSLQAFFFAEPVSEGATSVPS
jgi:hypothetical protein